MPSYVSKDGVVKPAKEKVVLYDENGDPHIYEGLDRAACEYMKEQGLDPESDHLGMHFTEDSQIIERAHDKNLTVEEFTKQKVNTQEKRDKHFEKVSAQVVNHKLPEKKNYKDKANSGGGKLKGGFGEGDAISDAEDSVSK